MTYEEARMAHPQAWVVCRGCGRQYWPMEGYRMSPSSDQPPTVVYADHCGDCEQKKRDQRQSFVMWLCYGRRRGQFDAVGSLAEAVGQDGNALMLSTQLETTDYLASRGFSVAALPQAWAEWEQWRAGK